MPGLRAPHPPEQRDQALHPLRGRGRGRCQSRPVPCAPVHEGLIADRIHTQLNSILNSHRTYLTGRGDHHAGRPLLPSLSNPSTRSQVSGMVHDQSATGSTLFIEPMAIVKLNNESPRTGDPGAEGDRGCPGFSQQPGRALILRSCRWTMAAVSHSWTFIFAKASTGPPATRCTAPVFQRYRGYIHIKDGRHPHCWIPQTAVPINVWLGKDFDLLIVTGPNTGGKTVSLKTVGLFHPHGPGRDCTSRPGKDPSWQCIRRGVCRYRR